MAKSEPPVKDGEICRCPSCTYPLSLELSPQGRVFEYCSWCGYEEDISKETS